MTLPHLRPTSPQRVVTALKIRAKSTARQLELLVVQTLLRVVPATDQVVVNGFPVNEGNAIEILRGLAGRYRGRVSWLVPDVDEARQVLKASRLTECGPIEVVSHRSGQGVWRFVRSEVSLFTHGLFGNPRRVPGKTMVNLWHGGGFKGSIMSDHLGRPTIHSDFLVGSTAQFGSELARQCRLPDGGLLLTGNPRTDQFARSQRVDLSSLGIDRSRPFVVWMPTFRRNKGRGLSAGWNELATSAPSAQPSGSPNDVMSDVVEVLSRQYGISVVIKPHPQDAEMRAVAGATVVLNEDLSHRGVQLYELLGAASGLLTDYSSVWIDYLALDRPIGFVVPDEGAYAAGRGFTPADALDWLPGPRLTSPADLAAFAEDVAEGGQNSRSRRREVAAHIGHVTGDRVADHVLDELDSRGVFRRGLKPTTQHSRSVPVP